ncbi:MAG: DegT/DnrJ/EryC1/StrS family aminotransferase [Candidatus Krumholzibacteriia bacterium]
MQVPFVDLKSQYRTIRDEIDQSLAAVIADTAFIAGKYARAFEEDFARYLGAAHCVGVGNGTDALQLAMRAAGIGPGDEVITAANTFVATPEGIALAGATPVFVDCDPRSYNLDPARIEAAITPRTRAIVPVHLYGQPADLDPILEIAGRHGLLVIEDAAQAHGAEYRGRKVGTLGQVACFSFYPGKNLGAYGDAGAVTTGDADLAHRVRMWTDHGSERKYEHAFVGTNSRLDGLQAAVLQVKLRHLDAWTERRRAVARRYGESLADVCAVPEELPERRHVYHLYVIRVANRDELMGHLQAEGIGCGIHYPVACPIQPAFAHLGLRPEEFPVAVGMQDQLVSLPMHGDLADEQVEFVVEQVRKVARRP